MSLVTRLVCVNCGHEYQGGSATTCLSCGPAPGILDVNYDLERARQTLTRSALRGRPANVWRYAELLPIDGSAPAALSHIGWTPIVETPRLATALGIRRLRLKDDGRNASGSFKDRASAVGVIRAMEGGYSEIACASTGNAASSLAHCAAAVGMPANIFVSRIVPEGKLAQLLAYGARVFKIEGTYAEAYDLCTRACGRFKWFNRNAAINPYLVEGKKTGGLELAEQCAGDPPDWVACSVGDGCSIAGVWKGIRQMKEIGVIDWSTRMLGVQAAGVAPIARMFATGEDANPDEGTTYADSINVPVPRNARKAINAVRESEGRFVVVSDDEIMEAVRLTGRLAGVFAEPAAAAAVAGVAAARRQGLIDADASVLAVITGTGLKDIKGALRAVGGPHVISPDLEAVVQIVEREAPASGAETG